MPLKLKKEVAAKHVPKKRRTKKKDAMVYALVWGG